MRLYINIQLVEQMDPHQVKSVYQLIAAGVRSMVTVKELTILVQHCPGGCCAACVGHPICLAFHVFVGVREIL